MKLKVNTKALIASTVALAVIPFTKATAETLEDWVARSVDEIKHDIQQSGENQQTYTIKYGDTLSSIAEALGIDVHVLANLNNISNMDLIYPGTVLKTTVNDQKEVTSVEIQTPQAGATDATVASADLTTNQVTVDDQTVAVNDLSKPVNEDNKAVPVAPAAETQEAPVVEVPATETPAQPAVPETPNYGAPAVNVEVQNQEVAPAAAPEAPATPEAPAAPQSAPVAEEAPAAQPAAETTAAPEVQPVAETSTSGNTIPNDPHLQPQAEAFRQEIAAKFGITNIGGYRAGDPDDHGKGLAVDVMVPTSSQLGDQVAQYAIDNMDRAGISYVIWKQQFYMPVDNIYGPANTWNQMPDRGGDTANHYDHVHISFNG
ncbi:M23 family metallopeptidase [Streptococcus parasanguinis]|uniref:LysM peptidoglycan-binding domain-containing protein n=1 Tax=Streptococcus parasanguinis TaxID=1318 RepID=A0A6L6LII0_STRPA|nr:LysM peptidoglycan-binding domain-containing protein [Streptococcus parasanguinis]MDU6946060.1 LysM peptidoglycan-binding domain-containing protein [Streptococcus parasanguinis]MTR62864.1 LysM peptidoglycan-binding domain-containing protein [Streptococcus parasanguinis]MTR65483.1 LysM peptidoglycan-binding domain-containing protein [Streptococcus parasanguinis]MTR69288.1 LysM peptidoglycan-binding domain-containing protein [Streptococcus parasanguinis]MTS05828.1 LysM peptidoglycan-binding d